MKIPAHLAIIMDGNGRWAETHCRERTFGHLRGARIAKTMIEHCADLGVKHLTLYAFSTENWLRPKQEVHFLMTLLARHLRKERASLMKNNIRFTTIGELDRLPAPVVAEVRKTVLETSRNTGLRLVFALSYGGRQEITRTVQYLAAEVAAGRLASTAITEELITSSLQTGDMPDPDLIIRTSGESRLSNFLMWQAAYSEFYVTQLLWPDFTITDLEAAFRYYGTRERRFGRTTAQMTAGHSVENVEAVTFDSFEVSFDPSLQEFNDDGSEAATESENSPSIHQAAL